MRAVLRCALLSAVAAACARAAAAPAAEACAWSAAGGGGGAGCDAASASEALRALHAELDAADARLDAERARLDAASARVAALRSALACGGAAAEGGAASHVAPSFALLPAPTNAPGAPGWAYRHAVAARPQPGWAQRLPLLAALRVPPPAHVTALLTLPPEHSPTQPPRLIAVGDSAGRVFVFTPGGALLAQAAGGGRGAVTALAAAPVRRNETAIAAGHANGAVSLLMLEEAGPSPWHPGAPPVLDEETGAPVLPALFLRELWVAPVAAGLDQSAEEPPSSSSAASAREVTLLEALPFAAGRLFVAADAGGGVAAFAAPSAVRVALREAGEALPMTWRAAVPRPVRALRAAAGGGGDARAPRRIVFVSDGGVGTLELPPAGQPLTGRARGKAAAASSDAPPALRTADCAGLNGTRIAAARFENSASNKFWAVSTAGEVLTVAAGFSATAPLCAVRSRRALPRGPDGGLPSPPYALAGLPPGFLVASSAEQLYVYDTAAPARPTRRAAASRMQPPQPPPGPRLVLTQSRGALAAPFAGMAAAGAEALPSCADGAPGNGTNAPDPGALLAAAPRGSLLLLALSGGLVGVFENALATTAKEGTGGGTASASAAPSAPFTPRDLWGQPIFVIAIMLVAYYQFRSSSAANSGAPAFGGWAPAAQGAGSARAAAAARAERRAAAAAAAAMTGGDGVERTFPPLRPRPIAGGDDEALRRAISAFENFSQQDNDAPAE